MKQIRQITERFRSRLSGTSQPSSSVQEPSESQEGPQPTLADLEPYRYTPLPTNECVRFAKNIRLENGAIHLSLEVAELADSPVFTALSYTWGCPSIHASERGVTAERKFSIICDGQKILITENLHDFLTLLAIDGKISSAAGRLPVWIDALCIDQENLQERAQQVRLMSIIYRVARRVLVWLGDDDGRVDTALQIILALNTQKLKDLGGLDSWLQYQRPDAIRPIGEFPSRQLHWDALAAFFARSWFYRMWVFQEITVAFEIRVQCGRRTMAWSDLVHVSEFLSKTNWGSILNAGLPAAWRKPAGFGSTPFLMEGYRKDIISGSVWKLQAALCHCRQFGATDPKDKIFAVGGITVYGTASGVKTVTEAFPPDYGRTVQETFMRATHIVANDSENLDLLHFVEDKSTRVVQGLPSWVPDYTVYADFLVAALHPSYDAAKGIEKCFHNLVDQRKARAITATGKTREFSTIST
jgi:Heterokaryon incompatibility protein (HET)